MIMSRTRTHPRTRAASHAQRVVALLGISAALTALAGCSSGQQSAAPTSTVIVVVPAPEPTASLGSATAPTDAPKPSAPAAPVIDAKGHPMTAFASPTGNIVCLLGGDSAWTVRCDIAQKTWQPPAKPASCQLDWGTALLLEGGRAGLLCAGDTVLGTAAPNQDATWWAGRPGSQSATTLGGPSVALAYGATIRGGSISCVSQTDGMHCTDSASGAGFDLAREAYRVR